MKTGITTVLTKMIVPFTLTATLALLDGAFEHNDRPRDKIALLE